MDIEALFGDGLYATTPLRLLAGLLAGALIGLERTFHGRPAGFRTHTLVCTASSLLMLLTVYQWELLADAPLETVRVDPTRMAQGIMTGIGFLGAGAIMKERFSIRGLTTAASIWITAAIGIMIGMGFYFAAALGVLLTLGTLSVFRWIESITPTLTYARLMVRSGAEQPTSEEELRRILGEFDISGTKTSYALDPERAGFEHSMTIRTTDDLNFARLAHHLRARKDILSFSITPSSD